jgi:hypothetical protein
MLSLVLPSGSMILTVAGQLAHALEDGVGRRHHGVEGHVVGEPNGVDRGVDTARGDTRR